MFKPPPPSPSSPSDPCNPKYSLWSTNHYKSVGKTDLHITRSHKAFLQHRKNLIKRFISNKASKVLQNTCFTRTCFCVGTGLKFCERATLPSGDMHKHITHLHACMIFQITIYKYFILTHAALLACINI